MNIQKKKRKLSINILIRKLTIIMTLMLYFKKEVMKFKKRMFLKSKARVLRTIILLMIIADILIVVTQPIVI